MIFFILFIECLQIELCAADTHTHTQSHLHTKSPLKLPEERKKKETMKLSYQFYFIYVALITIPANVFGLPFLFGTTAYKRHIIEYHTPPDDWNILSAPRSVTPHFHPRNETVHERHLDFPLMGTTNDEAVLQRLKDIKVSYHI